MVKLENFFYFLIDPSEFDVNEKSRLVIYDKIKNEFCFIKELEKGERFEGDFKDLASHYNLTYKIQIKQNGRWTDHVPYRHLMEEKITNDGLKYMFFPSDGADKLIIVFQAVNRIPGYNYIGTLADTKAHRLYIKDDYGTDIATHSSYYLGPNKSTLIADKVIKLIQNFCSILGIETQNCITMGSSKGGFASLFFGLKLNVGSIIAGGPQVLLGNFLNSAKEDSVNPPILTYLAGDNSNASVEWANSILPDMIAKQKDFFGNLYIHVGIGDTHYNSHVLPLIKILSDYSIKNVNIDIGEYYSHTELAHFFPIYIKDVMSKII